MYQLSPTSATFSYVEPPSFCPQLISIQHSNFLISCPVPFYCLLLLPSWLPCLFNLQLRVPPCFACFHIHFLQIFFATSQQWVITPILQTRKPPPPTAVSQPILFPSFYIYIMPVSKQQDSPHHLRLPGCSSHKPDSDSNSWMRVQVKNGKQHWPTYDSLTSLFFSL